MYRLKSFLCGLALLLTTLSLCFSESIDYIQSLAEFRNRFKEYSLRVDERDKYENEELLENIVKESFAYVPGIESFDVRMSYKLRDFLEEHENKIVFTSYRYLDAEDRDKIGYSVLFGDIVDTKEMQVEINNPELAKIVGDTMTWRAVYFEPENKSLTEHRNENYPVSDYAALNFKNKMTAYINIRHNDNELNAHEMMHIWQYENKKDNGKLIFPKYDEFQAMAFDLAFNAYNETDQPIDNIIWAANLDSNNYSYYDAGRFFEEFFEKKGYALENLKDLTPYEREQYGIELLQIYEKKGQDIF